MGIKTNRKISENLKKFRKNLQVYVEFRIQNIQRKKS